jgi:hypothetical protein
MDSLVIASRLALMEETIREQITMIASLSVQLEELRRTLVTDNEQQEHVEEEQVEEVEEVANRETRNELIQDILQLTQELDWTMYSKGTYLWFCKGDQTVPLTVEVHSNDSKTKHGYLTTYTRSWCKDSGIAYTTYQTNVEKLQWVPYTVDGTSKKSQRKRLDPMALSTSDIKSILIQFETIHL